MIDPRVRKLAELLIRHSTRLEKNEKVLIEAIDVPKEIVTALIEAAVEVGGVPLVLWKDNQVLRDLYQIGDEASVEKRLAVMGEVERFQMEKVQAYIGIRGSNNSTEMAQIPSEKMKVYQEKVFQHVHGEYRVPNTKWVVLRWPTPSMAQLAGMVPIGSKIFIST